MAGGETVEASDRIDVEVVYATPDQQRLIRLAVAPGTTAGEAIQVCGILAAFPEIDLARQTVGIFAQPVSLDTTLAAGDRVEIYRPLEVDPKAQRRARARAQREKNTGQPPDS